MADKERLRNSIKGLQRVKTWQLIVLLLIASVIAATFLRLNNIGMIERRVAVESADKAGDADILVNRLYDLQRYVSSHMNTDLGRGIYLEYSHNRANLAWQEGQYGVTNPNGNVYKKADEACSPNFAVYTTAYQLCITSELEKFPPANEVEANKNKPHIESYIHSFSSPRWTPDFAGWSLLVCAFILLLIIIRLVSIGILKLMLNRHYKRV